MVRLYKYAKKQIARLREEESGAAMIEYSILIGIITVGCIAAILLVGPWVTTQWTTLTAALGLGA